MESVYVGWIKVGVVVGVIIEIVEVLRCDLIRCWEDHDVSDYQF